MEKKIKTSAETRMGHIHHIKGSARHHKHHRNTAEAPQYSMQHPIGVPQAIGSLENQQSSMVLLP